MTLIRKEKKKNFRAILVNFDQWSDIAFYS